MKLQLDKRFKKSFRASFGGYDLRVGVLKDSPYKLAQEPKNPAMEDNIASYAGGPVRRKSRKDSGITVAEVSKRNRERLGFNYLAKPFDEKSAEVVKFLERFFQVVSGKGQVKRLENTLQACVRNPILRGEYGPQSSITTFVKGFNRPMIDTAQLFKSIKASARKKSIVSMLRGR